MPNYIVTCNKCQKSCEIALTVEQLQANKELGVIEIATKVDAFQCQKLDCAVTPCEAYVDIGAQGPNEFTFSRKGGNLPPTMAIRRKKELAELQRIHDEGYRSDSERKEIAHMAVEYEKKMGMEPGAIQGSKAPLKTVEEKTIFKQKAVKKTEDSMKKRRKTLGL